MLSRRDTLRLLAGTVGLVALPRGAWASRSVAASLPELVERSDRVALVTSQGGESAWEEVGSRRRIVTYTRVRVDELVAGVGADGELVVRTLGGRVGRIGQVVHGEARLLRGEPCLLFLREPEHGLHVVTARAQGHFPIRVDSDGVSRLRSSPNRGELAHHERSASHELVGRSVSEAKAVIRRSRRDER